MKRVFGIFLLGVFIGTTASLAILGNFSIEKIKKLITKATTHSSPTRSDASNPFQFSRKAPTQSPPKSHEGEIAPPTTPPPSRRTAKLSQETRAPKPTLARPDPQYKKHFPFVNTNAENRPAELTDAFLLNGGGNADSNYFSHHLHIKMMSELLERRGLPRQRIAIFETDGEDPHADQVITNHYKMLWLFEGLPEEQFFAPMNFVNTTLAGYRLQPAKRWSLKRWFRNYRRKIQGGEKRTLLLFVTDHGTRGRGPLGNKIELWKEQINVGQLRSYLRPLGQQVKVISVMSQCYSGGFANLLYKGPDRVHGHRCGFFSTLANREAYGCFPETATGQRIGHAYRFIKAMKRAQTFLQAHRQTLLTDETPDVPLATSDVYLEDELRRIARRKGLSFIPFVDQILQKIWQEQPPHLQEDIAMLKAVERHFELPIIRSLKALWKEIRRNRAMQKQVEKIDLWDKVFSEIKQQTIIQFYKRNNRIASLVEQETARSEIDQETSRVARLLYQAYRRFLDQNPLVKERIVSFHQHQKRIPEKVYLLQKREAFLLRLQVLLIRLAGLYYIHQSGTRQERSDLASLMSCERTSLGHRKIEGYLHSEGQLSEEEKAELQRRKKEEQILAKTPIRRLLPAWLGIVFKPTTSDWHPRFAQLAPGASQIVEVGPNTPASEAGLLPHDIIVSMDGRMLQFVNEIRERVMMANVKKKHYMMIFRRGRFKTISLHLKRLTLDGNELERLEADPNIQNSDTSVFGLKKRFKLPQKRRKEISPLVSLSGDPISIHKSGQATLLFFWATWCSGCKALVPYLRRLQTKYKRQGLRILAVTTDGKNLVQPFAKEWGPRFPFEIALDKQGQLSRHYRIESIPQLILFDKQKRQIFHLDRMPGNLPEYLDRKVAQALR